MVDAAKDFVRLFEVVWNTSPTLPLADRIGLAREAVAGLVSEDLLEFFRIPWPATAAESSVEMRRARQLMESDSEWLPPVGDRPALCLRAKYPEVSFAPLWEAVLDADPLASDRLRWS